MNVPRLFSYLPLPLFIAATPQTWVQVGGMVSERDYPREARAKGIEGDVTVAFFIGEGGRTHGCKTLDENVDASLLAASCGVIKTFRYRNPKNAVVVTVVHQRRQRFAWRLGSLCPKPAVDLICVRLEK